MPLYKADISRDGLAGRCLPRCYWKCGNSSSLDPYIDPISCLIRNVYLTVDVAAAGAEITADVIPSFGFDLSAL